MAVGSTSVYKVLSLKRNLFSLACVLVSGLLFWAAESLKMDYETCAAIMREFASAILVTIGIGLFWDVYGKQAYADELLEKAHIAQSIASAGVSRFTTFRSGELDWEHLFEGSHKLDLFVSWAATWRNTHVDRIDGLLSKPMASMRVLLPDPSDTRVVAELAKRFTMSSADVEQRIREAAAFFSGRKAKSGGNIEVRFTSQVPLYSFYVFASGAVFVLFNYTAVKEEPIPSVQCGKQGFLYSYLERQFNSLYEDGKPA